MNLYIDTNIYLTFFHLSSDDLEELRKLSLLQQKKKIILFLPEQTRGEFFRNREVKISDALKKFKDENLNNLFPQMCKAYTEYDKMRQAIKDFEQNKNALLDKLMTDIERKGLKADYIISEIFKNAVFIETNELLLNKGKMRYDLGNPPGKDKSYGDAINWESLLNVVPNGEDIHFITDDKDFVSPLNSDNFNSFLVEEWNNTKKSKLLFYKRLSQFFRIHFPDINLFSEIEKDLLIEKLGKSPNFRTSRLLLHELDELGNFTSAQINEILVASTLNKQVYWIGEDEDINEILTKFIETYKDSIDEQVLQRLKDRIQLNLNGSKTQKVLSL